ncbi:transposase InsO family protein [Paraburkholderia sp. 40]
MAASPRAAGARLEVEIYAAHQRSRESYGAGRLQRHLGAHGLHVGVHPIKRLRRKHGLRCNQKHKFKATTRLTHGLPVAPNLLDQAFAVTVPNQAWCGDIRYIATKPSKPHESMTQKPC